MRNYDDDLHEKLKALCYDGDRIFDHDYRHFAPITIGLTAKKWWWPEYFKYKDKNERYYAKERNVPEGYLVVSRDCFEPSSAYEEARSIIIDRHQIAIPMKWFFRMNDLDLYRQWEIIRVNILSLPQRVRHADRLYKALDVAYQYGMEEDFKALFYDLFVENPEELNRRVKLLHEREQKAIQKVKDCEARIRALKKEDGWNSEYEMLYQRYVRSELSMEMGFIQYLERYGNLTQTGWGLVLKSKVPGSLVNRIAILLNDLMVLVRKKRNAHLDRLFEESRHSFL